MPTSRRPADDREAGFTLVELMVVVAIIGMAAGAVVLSLPSSASGVRRTAEALAIDAAAVRDHAIVTGRRTMLTTTATGFTAHERRGGADVAIDDRRLGGLWPSGTTARAQRVRFDPTGLADEGRIVLTDRRDGSRATVLIAMDGRIHVPE